MACLPKMLGMASLVAASTLAAGARADDLSTARFMSFALRDHAPSLSEVQAVQAGSKTLAQLVDDWLGTPEHVARIERHFRDMFGVADGIQTVNSRYVLADQGGGVLALTGIASKASCDPSTAQQVSAWWLEPGQTVAMCPTALATSLKPTSDGAVLNCTKTNNSGISANGCGCGPLQILCIPKNLLGPLKMAIRDEFAQRGAYAYQQNLSWEDLLAGDFFYGNRLLYWYYVLSQTLLPKAVMPPQPDLEALQALSMTSPSRAAFPSGAIRAGVATAPGFLKNNDSYRSRVRAMTQSLLCKDVDPTLNVDNISTYLNPSFTSADKAHGTHATCAGCHYPMDNMASLNFGWDAQGQYQNPKSLIGHAFGEDGTGPAFLVGAFVTKADGFAACMARRAWEGFSGLPWASLSAADQASYTKAATSPQGLLTTLLKSPSLQNSRNLAPAAAAAPAPNSSGIDFTSTVAPILANSCSGGACHSPGSPVGGFIGDQGAVQAVAAAIASRIQVKGPGGMPPSGSGKTLSLTDQATLLKYLGN